VDTHQPYLSEFGKVLIYIVGTALFIAITLLVSRLIRPDRPNVEKLTPYESGEEPVGGAWTQFNVRFYVVALIFILFEIEIVFLFPWATVFAKKELMEETNGSWGWLAIIEAVIFIVVLALGLVYAWVKGFLDWVKPEPKVIHHQSPVPGDLYERINERYSQKRIDHSSEAKA
jgi:NADH-quinone oxidoreductase subunit A